MRLSQKEKRVSDRMVEKMSQKQRKAYWAQFRTCWDINPVTRKPANSRAYNRQRVKAGLRTADC